MKGPGLDDLAFLASGEAVRMKNKLLQEESAEQSMKSTTETLSFHRTTLRSRSIKLRSDSLRSASRETSSRKSELGRPKLPSRKRAEYDAPMLKSCLPAIGHDPVKCLLNEAQLAEELDLPPELLPTVTFYQTRFDFSRGDIFEVSTLLPNLLHLCLNESNLRSLRELGTRLPQLRSLWVARCLLQDFAGIQGLPSLTELYASYNQVGSLSELMMHEHLAYLDLEGNLIQSEEQLEFLSLLPNLAAVDLSHNPLPAPAGKYHFLLELGQRPVPREFTCESTLLDCQELGAILFENGLAREEVLTWVQGFCASSEESLVEDMVRATKAQLFERYFHSHSHNPFKRIDALFGNSHERSLCESGLEGDMVHELDGFIRNGKGLSQPDQDLIYELCNIVARAEDEETGKEEREEKCKDLIQNYEVSKILGKKGLELGRGLQSTAGARPRMRLRGHSGMNSTNLGPPQ